MFPSSAVRTARAQPQRSFLLNDTQTAEPSLFNAAELHSQMTYTSKTASRQAALLAFARCKIQALRAQHTQVPMSSSVQLRNLLHAKEELLRFFQLYETKVQFSFALAEFDQGMIQILPAAKIHLLPSLRSHFIF